MAIPGGWLGVAAAVVSGLLRPFPGMVDSRSAGGLRCQEQGSSWP